MKTNISLEEAGALAVEGLTPLGVEDVALRDALGRTLAEAVAAPMDQPPFPRSPLDGYALCAEDTAGADGAHPVRLKVMETLYAGDVPRVPLERGQAARIMTGAMLPAGCNCVVRQEDTDRGEETVCVRRAVGQFQNYCFRGEDYTAGSPLLGAGLRVDAAAAGVLASAGIDRVRVLRRPSVYLISTGDEVVPPSRHPLPPGKIYASNGELLLARLAELGIRETGCELAPDDPQAVAGAICRAAGRYDVVITTGGVSVGAKDILHEALPLLGAERMFWRVRVKPGTPVMYSRYAGTPVMSLSGNPFAAAVNFELLVRPILGALSGEGHFHTPRKRAVLDGVFEKSGGPRRFLRGRYEDGRVRLPAGHSSGQLASLVGCNCLVDLPEGSAPAAPGDTVEVLLL